MTRREAAARHGVVAWPVLLPLLLVGAWPARGAAQGVDTTRAVADTTPRTALDTTRGVAADTTPGAARDTSGAAADTSGAMRLGEMREGMAGGAFPERDSVFRDLAGRKGFRIVEYRGKTVGLNVPDRVIRLVDSAQADYGDAALRADTITYRSRLAFLAARGDILLLSPDQRQVTSDSVLYYDVSRKKGTVLAAHTRFAAQGAEWVVRGNAVPVGTDTLFVSPGQFSTCDLPQPHYWFQAGKIKMVSQDVIVAWPVTLYIENVPVAWLPFFAQDIRPDRRSGILPPQFGVNTIIRTGGTSGPGGTGRNVRDFGYYWAINRFMDARFTVDWYAGQWTQLNGRFRYKDIKKHLNGNVAVSEQFAQNGRNFTLNLQHSQKLGPGTSLDVSANYVQRPGTFQNRSFDTNQLTQTIDSDVKLQKTMSWANLSLGARRRQFLGPNGQLTSTLPALNLSFSPVTLFRAPGSQAGLFNNMTWSGSGSFQRNTRSSDLDTDMRSTTGSINQSLRLSDLSFSGSADYRDQLQTPKDSLGNDLPAYTQTSVTWQSSADYQVRLMGSTSLRPTVSLSGGLFRAFDRQDSILDTNDRFVSAPTRASVGATLSTDLYAFFPGFGPFTRIRHKISPNLTWRYSPAVSAPDTLSAVPGFPGGTFQAQNVLTVGISQTFEAKVHESAPEQVAGDTAAGRAGPGAPADTGAAARADTSARAPAETTGGAVADTVAGAAPGAPSPLPGRPPPAAVARERKVTLLAIRTTTPLRLDFAAHARGEPLVQTDQLTNSISSDLIRGFSLNMTHDLFEGTGPDRRFAPMLTRLNASFSITSGTSLGSIFGLGGEGGSRRPPPRTQRNPEGGQERRGGPWSLGLSYSLNRPRAGQFGSSNSTVQWNFSLQPTPNWRVSWSSSYNFSDHQFAQQTVDLTRTLHRWQASFHFTKVPNGNFLFDIQVSLTDVPQLHVNYDERSGLGR